MGEDKIKKSNDMEMESDGGEKDPMKSSKSQEEDNSDGGEEEEELDEGNEENNNVENENEDFEEDDIDGQEQEDETKLLLDNPSNLLTVDKVREVSYDVLARTRVLFNIFASIYGVNSVHYDSLKQSLVVTTVGRKA